jgi:hypothetical protein
MQRCWAEDPTCRPPFSGTAVLLQSSDSPGARLHAYHATWPFGRWAGLPLCHYHQNTWVTVRLHTDTDLLAQKSSKSFGAWHQR